MTKRNNLCEECVYRFKTDIRVQRSRVVTDKLKNRFEEIVTSSRVIKCVQKSLCLDNLSVPFCNSYKQKPEFREKAQERNLVPTF